jgi:hypothetical protein
MLEFPMPQLASNHLPGRRPQALPAQDDHAVTRLVFWAWFAAFLACAGRVLIAVV